MTTAPDPPIPEPAATGDAAGPSARCPVPRVWRRLGAAAFLFFLIKGLLWLIIPAALATGLIKSF